MNIFESLENLNVSEECFDEITGIVEEYINEVSSRKVKEYIKGREKQSEKAYQEAKKADEIHDKARLLYGNKSPITHDKYNKAFDASQKFWKAKEKVKKGKDYLKKTKERERFNKWKESYRPVGLSGLREDLLKEIMGIVEALLLTENDRKHLNDFKNASPDLNKKIYYEGPKVEYKPKTNEDPKEVIKDLGLVNDSILKKKEDN